MTHADAVWLVATATVAVCAALAVLAAARGRAWLALPSLAPATVGVYVRAFDDHITRPAHGWITALTIAAIALAVVAGGPLTTYVLGLTDRSEQRSRHPRPDPGPAAPEILRGGATIGYLERIAVVGAVGTGHLEILAGVIAIKGLGRFTELSTSEARERFIIGTLVSLLWAGLVAGLVWPIR